MVCALAVDGKRYGVQCIPVRGSKNSQNIEIFQVMVRDGAKLVMGRDVPSVLKANPRLQTQVVELPKLALHPAFDTWPEVIQTRQVLSSNHERGTLQELFEDLFGCIRRDILSYFQKNSKDSSIDFNNIPMIFQVSVPSMWGDQQTGIVRNAAHQEGIRLELRDEALCASTAAMLEMFKSRQIKLDQSVLMLDVGGGTSDAATCMLIQEPADDQEMGLQRMGPSSGTPTGSHMLNNELKKYIASGLCPAVPDLQEACKGLGMTQMES